MADEKLTIELAVEGAARAMQSLGQVSNAVGSLGGGGLGGAGGAIGAASRFGAAAAAAGVVAVALAALAGAVKRATESLNEFGRLQDMLGSTTAETAMLKTITGALGIGDPAGFAATLRQNSLGGLGAATAARLGMPISPFDIGQGLDEGELALKFFEGLRKTAREQGMGQALSDARNLGVPQAIQAARISETMWKQIIRDGREAAALLGPKHQQRAFELNFAMTRLSQKWEFLKTLFLTALLPALETFINGLILFLRLIATNPLSGIKQQEIDAALNANTRAQNQNTRMLERMVGIWGGGARTRGAIPSAFGPGTGYGDAIRAHSIRLGAVAITL